MRTTSAVFYQQHSPVLPFPMLPLIALRRSLCIILQSQRRHGHRRFCSNDCSAIHTKYLRKPLAGLNRCSSAWLLRRQIHYSCLQCFEYSSLKCTDIPDSSESRKEGTIDIKMENTVEVKFLKQPLMAKSQNAHCTVIVHRVSLQLTPLSLRHSEPFLPLFIFRASPLFNTASFHAKFLNDFTPDLFLC